MADKNFELEEARRTLEVAKLVLEETKGGHVDWRADPEAEDGYQAFVAGKELFVRSSDGDGRHPFLFVILDTGQALARLETREQIAGLPSGWERTIAELYTEARTRGEPTTKALDEIMGELRRRKQQRDMEPPF